MQPYVLDRKPPIGAVLNPYLPINQGILCFPIMWEGGERPIEDLSGNRNAGNGFAMVWGEGKYGSVVVFDGVSTTGTRIDFGSSPVFNLTDNFTIHIVVNASVRYYRGIVGKYNYSPYTGYVLVDRSGNWAFETGDGIGRDILLSGIAPTLGQWYTLDAVVRNGTKHIYVDGILRNSSSPTIAVSAQNLWMGKYYGNSTANFWYGLIDHGMIYNRALDTSEIVELIKEPFCGFRWMSIEQLTAAEGEAPPPEIQALFMDLSTQLWTIKHSQGLFTKL